MWSMKSFLTLEVKEEIPYPGGQWRMASLDSWSMGEGPPYIVNYWERGTLTLGVSGRITPLHWWLVGGMLPSLVVPGKNNL